MRILLHDNQICERGTTTSMLDYGRVLRSRGHEVDISYWIDAPANVPSVIEAAAQEFALVPHTGQYSMSGIAQQYDSAYFIKAGFNDGLIMPGTHSMIHAVFQEYDPHGSRYAYISEWLASEMRNRVRGHGRKAAELHELEREAMAAGCMNAPDFEHLDLIVDIPSPQGGMRAQLGVPDDAFVILRFGGLDTFDIEWAREVVLGELEKNSDVYFVGLNTERFTSHKRALFIPMVLDPVEKASIISSADVFLTARGQGEAFGVAIAEALQIGIPVLAWNGGADRNHIAMLAGLDALFRTPRDLRRRLRRLARGKDPSSVTERQARGNLYRPEHVVPHLERLLTPS